MSYQRRALSGIQSLPPGPQVSRRALGDIIEYGTLAGPHARARPPRWYTAMQGTTLGNDEDQTRSANALQNIHMAIEAGIKKAETQKWLQLAATLSIPLAAMVWRAILKRRVSTGDGS